VGDGLQVYARHPGPALTLAYQLIEIKRSLKRGQKGIPDVIAGLDLAVEALYPHTDFDNMGRTFFSEQSKAGLNLIRKKAATAWCEVMTNYLLLPYHGIWLDKRFKSRVVEGSEWSVC
jgi:hypothetical protein